ISYSATTHAMFYLLTYIDTLSLFLFLFFLILPPPPISTLFPYTTLFRSPFFVVTRPLSCFPFLRNIRRSGPYCCTRPASANISQDRKSTRLNSSHVKISYAVFCLKKKNNIEIIL